MTLKKRSGLLIAAAAALVLVVAAMAVRSSPATRTKAYFTLTKEWRQHWPLPRGKALPVRLRPLMEPFEPIWFELEPHMTMWLDPYDVVPAFILDTGTWEPEVRQGIQDHLTRGATFIDVGAHIGYHSLHAAVTVGPSGHVLAIEPNPETLPVLRKNIQASEAGNVVVEPVACSDSETTVVLYAAPRANTGESSMAVRNASQEGPAAAAYRVRARPLDDIVKEAGLTRVDVIKIDVEGAEVLVLKGAKQTLATYHPVIIAEVVDEQLKAMGSSIQEFHALMASLGYAKSHRVDEQNVEFWPQQIPPTPPTPARASPETR